MAYIKKITSNIRYLYQLIRSRLDKNVLVCFGTSLTAGSGWVKMLQDELPQYYVINFGKGGSNSNWGIDNIHRVLWLRPKIVLMEFAINDAYVRPNPVCDTPAIYDSLDNMQAMFRIFQRRKIQVYLLLTNPPFDKFCYGRNPAEDRPEFKKFQDEHRLLAEAYDIPIIDTYSGWLKYKDSIYLDELIPDRLHPSKIGSQQITVPVILKALQ